MFGGSSEELADTIVAPALGFLLITPLKQNVAHAVNSRPVYAEVEEPGGVVRAELQVVFYQAPYFLVFPLQSLRPLKFCWTCSSFPD